MATKKLEAMTPRSRLAMLQALQAGNQGGPSYSAGEALAKAGSSALNAYMAKTLMDQEAQAVTAAQDKRSQAFAALLGQNQAVPGVSGPSGAGGVPSGISEFPSGAPVQSAQIAEQPQQGGLSRERLIKALSMDPSSASELTSLYSALAKDKLDPKDNLLGVPGEGGVYDIQKGVIIPGTQIPKDDNVLVEIADPKSPTGTRMVKRSDAIGMPGKPGSQMRLVTGPDGSVTFEQGTGLGGGGIQKTTANQLEKDIVGLQGSYADALKMASSVDANMLTLPAKLNQGWNSLRDKSGLEALALSPEEQQSLGSYTQMRQDAYNFFNAKMKEMAGTAVTESEAERQYKALPNPDNDGPTEYNTKIKGQLNFMENALARKQYALKNGVDWKTIPLGDMDKIMENRANQIYEMAKRGGASDDEAKQRAVQATRIEFGLMK